MEWGRKGYKINEKSQQSMDACACMRGVEMEKDDLK